MPLTISQIEAALKVLQNRVAVLETTSPAIVINTLREELKNSVTRLIDVIKIIPSSGTPPSTGTPPPILPDTNIYPFHMPSTEIPPGSPVTFGIGKDRLEINISNPGTIFKIIRDDVQAVAVGLPVTGVWPGTQIFVILGNWGPGPHTWDIIGDPNIGACVVSVSYNYIPLVSQYTGSRGDKYVNEVKVWNSAQTSMRFGAPVPVALPPSIPANVKPLGHTAITTNLTLGEGTFSGSATIDAPVIIKGAGMGKTIIDCTGIEIKMGKAILVPTVGGVVISDLSLRGVGINDDGASSGVRQNDFGPNKNFTLERVEISGRPQGILTFPANVIIRECNLHDNGTGDGFTHNFYGNGDPSTIIIIENTKTARAIGGHEIKSRAGTTLIDRLFAVGGGGSSIVDIPDGGLCSIKGSDLTLPPDNSNHTFIGFAMESVKNLATGNKLKIENTILRGGTNEIPGYIQSGNKEAILEFGANVTYTGPVAPQLIGWKSIIGTMTKGL